VTVLLMVVVVVVFVAVCSTPFISHRQTSFDVAVFENEVRWL
jgi:hypothetical protein